jgi:hypothetical protein
VTSVYKDIFGKKDIKKIDKDITQVSHPFRGEVVIKLIE